MFRVQDSENTPARHGPGRQAGRPGRRPPTLDPLPLAPPCSRRSRDKGVRSPSGSSLGGTFNANAPLMAILSKCVPASCVLCALCPARCARCPCCPLVQPSPAVPAVPAACPGCHLSGLRSCLPACSIRKVGSEEGDGEEHSPTLVTAASLALVSKARALPIL